MEFFTTNLAPIMFGGLMLFLLLHHYKQKLLLPRINNRWEI